MIKFLHKLPNHQQGIFYAIASSLFVSIMVSLVRELSTSYHVFFIVMIRNFFALMFFMPQIIRDHKGILYTKRLSLHIFRGANGLIAMFIWFYAVSVLPLSEAVSLSFLAPILTTMAAVFFLKEKMKKNGYLALIIGLIGILIILRPGFREFKFAHLLCLLTVMMWAITNITIKTMIKTEKPQTIVAYMSLTMLILSIPFALPYIKAIPMRDLAYFALVGAFSNLAHVAISTSYSKSDISHLQPFDFTRLIFTAIISYFFFGEIIDFWVIIGSATILLGVIIIMPKQKTLKKEALLRD